MKTDFRKTSEIVRQVLVQKPATRNGDELLYLEVCELVNYECLKHSFRFMLKNRKEYGLPSYETVSRCRRKLQAKFPELRATDRVQAARSELEKEYKSFAIEN